MAELITGNPLFPAINEKELLEFYIIRIGWPPKEMTDHCKKKRTFFDSNGKLIKSKASRVPPGSEPGSDSVAHTLRHEKDKSLVDFIIQCLVIDPAKRMTPQQALAHPWLAHIENEIEERDKEIAEKRK